MAKHRLYTLNDRQKRVLHALKKIQEKRDGQMTTNIRTRATKHCIHYSALQRVSLKPPTESTILEQGEEGRRKIRLEDQEEQLIVDAAFYIQDNGTLLNRNCF